MAVATSLELSLSTKPSDQRDQIPDNDCDSRVLSNYTSSFSPSSPRLEFDVFTNFKSRSSMGQLDLVIQDSSPFITYSPGWFEGTHNVTRDPSFAKYNGTFRPTETGNSQAMFSFTGTAAAILGAFRNNHGNYSVILDDQMAVTQSGFSNPDQFNQTLWSISNITYQEHDVTITNLPDSHGSFLDIDSILIQRQIGNNNDPIFQITLEDNSSVGINYMGSWAQIQEPTASKNGLHRTASAGSQMSITFRGCCLEVYGQYANANYTVALDDQIPRTYTGLNLDLNDTQQHPQSLLYLVDNLSEDDLHTVLMTNLNSLEQRPFFFDYAVISSTKGIDFGTTSTTNSTKGNPNPTMKATTSKKTNVAVIAGATVAGIIILSIIGMTAFVLLKRKKKRAQHPSQLEGRFVAGGVQPYVVPSNKYVQARPKGPLASRSMDNVSSLPGVNMISSSKIMSQRQVGLSSYREQDSDTTFRNSIDHIQPMLPPEYNSEWNLTP